MDRPRRLPDFWAGASAARLMMSALIMASLLCLSALYERAIPGLGRSWDVWFGADMARFSTLWMSGGADRAFLHPLPFVLYWAFGLSMRLVGATPALLPLPVLAGPVILIVSLAIVETMGLLVQSMCVTAGPAKSACIAAVLTSGPLLIFGAVPESHMVGGAFLLLEAAYLLPVIPRRRARGGDGFTSRRSRAILCAALAALSTLSNFVPALLLLIGLAPEVLVWLNRRRRVVVMGGVGAVTLLTIVSACSSRCFHLVAYELAFLRRPTWESLRSSLTGLIAPQFAVPLIQMDMRASSVGGTPQLVPATSVLTLLVTTLWIAVVVLWVVCRGRIHCRRALAMTASGALVSLVILHATYSSQEAFLFAPHAWGILMIPTLAAVADTVATGGRIRTSLCLAAIMLSMIQSVLGLHSLFSASPGR